MYNGGQKNMYESNETKELNDYKYAAFISYRHADLDKYVAEQIHKYLENFKLPKSVRNRKNLKRTKIDRVFMDKEELTITNNLEDPIVQALKNSEYLIVICSPRIKESIWCCKEIETFIGFHGRSKILTVLIEGDPSTSFPDELLFDEEIVKENGITSVHRKDVEPLAADVRAENRSGIRKLLKTELLRVIAPMFGLEFDDLRQRHRERKIRRMITATVASAAIGAIIGVAGITSALIINNQNKRIEEQSARIEQQNTTLLYNQAANLADKSIQMLEQDRRIEALEAAVNSVTEYDGIKMPYTPEGKYALAKALRVYDNLSVYKAQNQFISKANITQMSMSASRTYMMTVDYAYNLCVWDLNTDELVIRLDNVDSYKLDFLGDKGIVYINEAGKVIIADFENNQKEIDLGLNSNIDGIKADRAGEHIAIIIENRLMIYNVSGEDCELILDYEAQDPCEINSDMIFENNKLIYTENTYTMIEDVEHIDSVLKMLDINSGESISIAGNYFSVSEAKSLDRVMYISANCTDTETTKNFGCILAVDEVTGQVLWQNNYNDGSISRLYIARFDGFTYVIASSYGNFYCLNATDGSNIYSSSVTEGIGDMVITTEGIAHILTCKGTFVNYNIRTKESFSMDYILECNIGDIDEARIFANGYVMTPMLKNYVVKYSKVIDEEVEEVQVSEDMAEEYYDSLYVDMDYQEEANKIGIEKYDIVDGLCYVDGGKIALVRFYDMSLDVYDVGKKKTIKTISNIGEAPVKELDVDSEGNIYVLGLNAGYCFDKDYNLIAEVDNMITVNTDEEYIIVGDIEGIAYKYPLYSLDDLISKAKKIIK